MEQSSLKTKEVGIGIFLKDAKGDTVAAPCKNMKTSLDWLEAEPMTTEHATKFVGIICLSIDLCIES